MNIQRVWRDVSAAGAAVIVATTAVLVGFAAGPTLSGDDLPLTAAAQATATKSKGKTHIIKVMGNVKWNDIELKRSAAR